MNTTLHFLLNHPLTRGRPLAALLRFGMWQIKSRLQDEVEFDWIGEAKLAVRRGMTGATGNIYAGLHEFADMAFLLHLLRPRDLFIDVGANVGTYTVLAAKVCGADAIAVEPDPTTQKALERNIVLNGIESRAHVEGVALGAASGTVRFTTGLDTVNRVLTGTMDAYVPGQEVPLRRLDDIIRGRVPILMKLDVETYEAEVLKGAVRTLRQPGVLAVESESDHPDVIALLNDAGFARAYYNPFTRSLSQEKNSLAVNALFIRDFDKCNNRCAAAPEYIILGRQI